MGAHILGDFRNQPHCGLPQSYFEARDCWVDCRAIDCLWISDKANIGWEVKFITLSHNIDPGYFGQLIEKRLTIEKDAFIAYGAMLYNCTIGEGAVVALGSVVRSMVVAPWTMVAGNPARIIKRYNFETRKWEKA